MITGTEIGLGGIVVGGLGVLTSPITAFLGARFSRNNEHASWLRERRYVAYTAVLEHVEEHQHWREIARRVYNVRPDYPNPPTSDAFSRAKIVSSPDVKVLLEEVEELERDFFMSLAPGFDDELPWTPEQEVFELDQKTQAAEAALSRAITVEFSLPVRLVT